MKILKTYLSQEDRTDSTDGRSGKRPYPLPGSSHPGNVLWSKVLPGKLSDVE
jgi:hypothetical protein